MSCTAARYLLMLLLLLAWHPASAETSRGIAAPLEIVIGNVTHDVESQEVVAELLLINEGPEAETIPLPDLVQADIASAQSQSKAWLRRSDETSSEISVPPGGFARVGYAMHNPPETDLSNALLTIPAWTQQQVAISQRDGVLAQRDGPQEAPQQSAEDDERATWTMAPPADRNAGNDLLDNLTAYEPIYAIFGPGTNTAAKIQISFQYRLFGSSNAKEKQASWRDGIHFAYTQRMFWDVDAESSPFHNIDFLPELTYVSPSATLGNRISLGGQVGLRHESNGRAGPESRSLNALYVAPMASMPLGGEYRMVVAPRLSFLVGDKSENPDILDYRGTTSLFVEIGKDDGLRLSTATRFNFATGNGAVFADLSYPLQNIWRSAPAFYLFAQGFTGYGENLLDYDQRATRLRVGFALVR